MFLDRYFEPRKDWGALFIRLAVGARIAIGAFDAIRKEGQMDMAKQYFSNLGFPAPEACVYVSVYAQLICGILFIIGFFTRAAAVVMIINFAVAIIVAHADDSFMDAFVPWVILASSIFLMFNGAGKYSLDGMMRKRDLKIR